MSFFKDFKDDLSTAVNEMMPGEEAVEEKNEEIEEAVETKMEELNEMLKETTARHATRPVEPAQTPKFTSAPTFTSAPISHEAFATNSNVTDETAVITEGMTINGNLDSTGSVEVRGTVIGDVKCNGKLVVTGMITGNTQSSEFFADNARIQGEIVAEGSVKVGAGSVIIGNISSTSSVIAGAVKGDIDVRGPVVVDTSAVVVGNIKSRTVQINNGAVIEGFCSQSYAEIDVQNFFG